ncbi:helix-turn-helix domain-containing protein [Desulfococcaceae bacterium HSG7]|nr:helix-turn-helix domain-containing protein [Desulfococcaceae bacterium HSG7]
MSTKKTLDVKKIIQRAKISLDLKRDVQLAKALNVGPTTISTWKSRGNIDLFNIIALCEHVNIDWLVFGRGSMKPDKIESEIILEKINMIIRHMNHDEQRDVLKYVRREEALKELLREYNKKAV